MLVVGVGLVLYKSNNDDSKDTNVVWYGELLLVLSLMFDGICHGYEVNYLFYF